MSALHLIILLGSVSVASVVVVFTPLLAWMRRRDRKFRERQAAQWMRLSGVYACEHMQIGGGNVTAAACGICGPLMLAPNATAVA